MLGLVSRVEGSGLRVEAFEIRGDGSAFRV